MGDLADVLDADGVPVSLAVRTMFSIVMEVRSPYPGHVSSAKLYQRPPPRHCRLDASTTRLMECVGLKLLGHIHLVLRTNRRGRRPRNAWHGFNNT